MIHSTSPHLSQQEVLVPFRDDVRKIGRIFSVGRRPANHSDRLLVEKESRKRPFEEVRICLRFRKNLQSNTSSNYLQLMVMDRARRGELGGDENGMLFVFVQGSFQI